MGVDPGPDADCRNAHLRHAGEPGLSRGVGRGLNLHHRGGRTIAPPEHRLPDQERSRQEVPDHVEDVERLGERAVGQHACLFHQMRLGHEGRAKHQHGDDDQNRKRKLADESHGGVNRWKNGADWVGCDRSPAAEWPARR